MGAAAFRRFAGNAAAERNAEAERDAIVKFPEWLVAEGVLDRHALQRMVHEIDMEIQQQQEQQQQQGDEPC